MCRLLRDLFCAFVFARKSLDNMRGVFLFALLIAPFSLVGAVVVGRPLEVRDVTCFSGASDTVRCPAGSKCATITTINGNLYGCAASNDLGRGSSGFSCSAPNIACCDGDFCNGTMRTGIINDDTFPCKPQRASYNASVAIKGTEKPTRWRSRSAPTLLSAWLPGLSSLLLSCTASCTS